MRQGFPMLKPLAPGIAAMAAIVVLSNILVQHLLGDWLTWAAFTYPFAFLVTDIVNRLQGAENARRVVFAGFLVGVACSIVGSQIIGDLGPLVTLRIAIGSGIAFLAAQLIDVALFNRLREGSWWRAPLVSSIVGSTIDTVLFFTIAFSGWLAWVEPLNDVGWANDMEPILGVWVDAPYWVSLAIADYGVKLAIILVSLIPFRVLVERFRTA